jgi:pimeloyl-ACP methyl ester carboxylesterase
MKSIRANNIEIAYQDLGSGPPFLLIHGFSLDYSMWSAQVEELQKSYRLIIPDLRGAGETGDRGEPYSIETMADDAAALLEALGIEFAVVAGHSMGGFILVHMLVRHPSKVRAAGFVSTQTTTAGTSEPDAKFKSPDYKAMANFVTDEGSEAFAATFIPKLFSPGYIESHPSEVAQTRSVIEGQSPDSIALMLDALRQRPDMAAHLKEFTVPSFAVVGNEDAIVPVAAMQAIHDGVSDSVFEIIEGAGHMTPVEAPEKVSSLLDQLMQRAGM